MKLKKEEEWVDALKKGEPQSIEKAITVYGTPLLRSAFLLCGSEVEAHDMVQETFLQAIKSIHRFKGKSSTEKSSHQSTQTKQSCTGKKRRRKNEDLPFLMSTDLPDAPSMAISSSAIQIKRKSLYTLRMGEWCAALLSILIHY